MVLHTYAEAFWGGDLSSIAGSEALTKRNQEGKKMCQELEEYMKKRSKLELDYSKTLSTLGKCFKTKETSGILEESLNQLKIEIDNMAISHQGASIFFSQQADNMKKFRDEQSTKKKQKEEALQRVQNAKLAQLSKTVQLEKTYYKKCVDRDTAVTLAKEADADNSPVAPKELEKVRNRAIKAEDDVQKADNAYKSAVIVLEDSRTNWEKEMMSLCEVSQDLDEARIHYLRKEVWTCLNVDSKLALDIDNSCENVRLKLENCTITDDIMRFLHKASTGSVKPEHFRYTAYNQKKASGENCSSGDAYVNVDITTRSDKRRK